MSIYSFFNNTLGKRCLVFAKNKREARQILSLVDHDQDLMQLDEFCAFTLLRDGYGAYRRINTITGAYNEFFTFNDFLKGSKQ